jgi:ParB family chromosome partitioning protein
LGALIADAETNQEPLAIPMEAIEPNPYQPRRQFDPQALDELAQSIREHGILQPILVRMLPGGKYQLVAGERRLRAAKLAGMTTIPGLAKELSDRQMAEIALIENLQREDLNPIEEAEAYRKLIDEFNLTQETLANRLGKSRPAIANCLRLLNLEKEVREMIAQGQLSSGHGRTLLGLAREQQLVAARGIIQGGLTVRDAEKNKKPEPKPAPAKDANLYDLQRRLMEHLGTKVVLEQQGERGKIIIDFYSQEDADRIIEAILPDVQ